MTATIFALSSGAPPAAIAIVRVTGVQAFSALRSLTGRELPAPRRAVLRTLRLGDTVLDSALVLCFPRSGSVTGDDLVELHLHGGRATVAAVLTALGSIEGLRIAEPGEFTRRAFENGRIDLSAVEGLADLLRAETELQRRAALNIASGGLSVVVKDFRDALMDASARVEAAIDFAEEDDVLPWPGRARALKDLAGRVDSILASPPAERLRDGVRIVIAGPPNAGKSSLVNALCLREAAIVSDLAGTTRDAIEVPVQLQGIPIIYVDTAGFRDNPSDAIEAIGISRAAQQVEASDIVIWLGEPEAAPQHEVVICVRTKSDLAYSGSDDRLACSARTGENVSALANRIASEAKRLVPDESKLALNLRQRTGLRQLRDECTLASASGDLVICAEHLRRGRLAIDRLLGSAGTEQMLDALFSEFCIGK